MPSYACSFISDTIVHMKADQSTQKLIAQCFKQYEYVYRDTKIMVVRDRHNAYMLITTEAKVKMGRLGS